MVWGKSAPVIDAQFQERIDAFVAECKTQYDLYHERNKFTFAPDTFEVTYGEKWALIWQTGGSNRSAHSFIALVDFENKALGKVKQGDIHKPASWKVPAKTARGNVFPLDFGKPFDGSYHIRYLR